MENARGEKLGVDENGNLTWQVIRTDSAAFAPPQVSCCNVYVSGTEFSFVFSGEGKLVDFVNFTFTKGSLLLPRGLKIEQVEGTERRFRVSWQEEREWATATGSDLLQIGVLYDSLPLGPRLAVSVSGRRQDLCGEFTLSERATDGAHVYCFFAREDGSAYSDCQYFRISAIPSHPQHTT